MNKTEVIKKVSEKCGISQHDCEKIIKMFEKQSETLLTNKFRGIKNNRTDVLLGVSERSGISVDKCENVLKALDEVIDSALLKKINFFNK